MIVNPSSIEEKYECGKMIMEYLVYKCDIPILGIEGNKFYFANTQKLRNALKEMPLYLKIFGGLMK